ncbi:MAG: hypothetical protein R3A10_15120 [Caldilineaceae bacterium]
MNITVRVGLSTCGPRREGQAVFNAGPPRCASTLPVTLQPTGCVGACRREPLVEVVDNGVTTLYGPVAPGGAPLLLRHLGTAPAGDAGPPVVSRHADRHDYPFLGRQVKVTTGLCGVIDPHSLDDYLAYDGYAALRQAPADMKPEAIIQVVKDAHLRGRGGAGFPTGQKWGDQPPSSRPAQVHHLQC